MKLKNYFSISIIAVVFLCKVNSPAQEFVPLFNGENLDGWVNVNCAPETWSVVDGMIHCTGVPTGVIRTERMYENYILELEYRHLVEKGNSGLFVHSDPLPITGKPFTRSIEIQILDGRNTKDYTSHGDIFGIQGATMAPSPLHPGGWMRSLPQKRLAKPVGEWNIYRVECRDGVVLLSVNGELVTRAFYVNPRKGYICLEAEGGVIDFRNIRISEFPGSQPPPEVTAKSAEGFRPLFNGVDFRGWKQAKGNEGHWIIEDGIIKYDGKSTADGDDKHLWTEQEFEDFVLIVDWKQSGTATIDNVPIVLPDGSNLKDAGGEEAKIEIKDAGDSGIYIRGSSKSQINIWNWPVGSGEIWGYRTDTSMSPEVRRAATPIQNADNPIGDWNRFRITVRGEIVNVELNDKVVIRDAVLSGMPAKGPIALQHHGDEIEFTNVFIKTID